jgi:HAMP domain-containing protein/putative methionine-R-sulfoxide reductase with GAF domain
LAFLAAAVIPALIISVFGVLSQVSRVRSDVGKNLDLLATLQENQVEQWISSQIAALSSLAHDPSLERQIRSFLVTNTSESDKQTARLSINAHLSSFLVQHADFDEVFLLSGDGRVAASTDVTHQGQLETEAPYFDQGSEARFFAPSVFVDRLEHSSLVVAEPLRYVTGEPIGVLVGLVKPEPLARLMQSAPGLGESGQTYLVDKEGALVTPLRNKEKPALGEAVTSPGAAKVVAGISGRSTYSNYEGQTVLGVYRWLPEVQMGLLAEQRLAEALRSSYLAVGATVIVTLVAIGLAAMLGSKMAGRIARPVIEITEAAKKMVAGDLKQSVAINRSDEIGDLGLAFNQMADQLRMTIGSLENTVAERTEQLQQASDQYRMRTIHLEASAEISRAAASILDPQELMQSTAELIREQFDFNHVSFFLIDQTGDWAAVVASTGEVGQLRVAQPHRLPVGGESMVGWVCAHGQPRIAFNVGSDAVPFDNPLLPDTRSEMVVPLLVGNQLLGALDVQSDREAAFGEDDVRTLQGMTDLIAITLHNARLFTETQRGAQHQEFITRVTDQMQRANSITDIMTLTLEELGETFDLAQATVCLGTEAELGTAGSGNGGRPNDKRG